MTLLPPALCPKIMMLSPSPPNAAMLAFTHRMASRYNRRAHRYTQSERQGGRGRMNDVTRTRRKCDRKEQKEKLLAHLILNALVAALRIQKVAATEQSSHKTV